MPLRCLLRTRPRLLPLALLLLLPTTARPDEDENEREHEGREKRLEQRGGAGRTTQRREREEEEAGSSGGGSLQPATDPTYTGTCSQCHFAYPPDLLPARSWEKILGRTDKHFGESFDLDAKERKAIGDYLRTHAADTSRAKQARAIMRSVGSTTPERITEIPYIRGKHDEISAEVFKRKAVGSRSKCNACHRGAARGAFSEEDVSIPK